MANSHSHDRRKFITLCVGAGAAVAANPGLLAQPAGDLAPARPVRLVDPDGRPVRPGTLTTGKSYVFHYPYVTTPCFLIDLGSPARPGAELTTADGRPYRWRGGVGPGRSIVAFSAICAHRMSYPSRAVSFIDYRHKPVTAAGADGEARGREQVIYCCSEGSVYDPRDGGRVLDGPAPQPLAAVQLEYAAEERELVAAGIYGGDMLERFFTEFGFQLALAHKSDDIRRPAEGMATVWPLDEYSKTGVC